MIGKAEWFKSRQYLGWGVFPVTWQGWLYFVIFLALIFGIQIVPFFNDKTKTIMIVILAAILVVDVIHIMLTMKKDERDRIHEAIAERNALWTILLVLVIGVGYQAARSVVLKINSIDWFIIAALFAGLAVKAITNIYLDRRD